MLWRVEEFDRWYESVGRLRALPLDVSMLKR